MEDDVDDMQPQMMSMKEMGIAGALREGNLRRAFELLLESFQEEIYRYCVTLSGEASALRVYEQILTVAGAELLTLSPTASLRAWFYRLARRMVTHEHRRQGREGALAVDYVPTMRSLPRQASVGGAGTFSSLGADVSAFEVLPPDILEILQLSLWQGLRLDEVAEVIERPLSEVRFSAAQGLSRLAAERCVAMSGGALPS